MARARALRRRTWPLRTRAMFHTAGARAPVPRSRNYARTAGLTRGANEPRRTGGEDCIATRIPSGTVAVAVLVDCRRCVARCRGLGRPPRVSRASHERVRPGARDRTRLLHAGREAQAAALLGRIDDHERAEPLDRRAAGHDLRSPDRAAPRPRGRRAVAKTAAPEAVSRDRCDPNQFRGALFDVRRARRQPLVVCDFPRAAQPDRAPASAGADHVGSVGVESGARRSGHVRRRRVSGTRRPAGDAAGARRQRLAGGRAGAARRGVGLLDRLRLSRRRDVPGEGIPPLGREEHQLLLTTGHDRRERHLQDQARRDHHAGKPLVRSVLRHFPGRRRYPGSRRQPRHGAVRPRSAERQLRQALPRHQRQELRRPPRRGQRDGRHGLHRRHDPHRLPDGRLRRPGREGI